jgi:very-long-chain (3R)-3-hydroxyacyl-CoA dehydratase
MKWFVVSLPSVIPNKQIADFVMQARSNPLVATMYLAWSITEVLRYSYYVFSLLPSREIPYPLVWLRYTTFYVLYPLGAGSEAFLNYSTLPSGSPVPSTMKAVIGRGWLLTDYARALLFFIWWPSAYT